MKKIILTLLVGSICVLLCACGNSQQANKTDMDVAKSQQENKENTNDVTVEEQLESLIETVTTVVQEKFTPTISLGETIVTDAFEFTLNRVELSYEVEPDNPPSHYSYYVADLGQVYVYVNATVKNTSKHGIACDEIYSVNVDYNNGYMYNGFNIVTDTDGDFTYSSITNIKPLQTLDIHCLVDCPEEIAISENPLVLTIKFKTGESYIYTVR